MSFRIEEKLLINKYQLSEFKEYLISKGAYKIFETRKINNLYFDNDKFEMFNDSNNLWINVWDKGMIPFVCIMGF